MMMKLVILGATGGIGRLLIDGALEQGHEVTAFARAPEKVTEKSSRLQVIGGDLYDQQQLTAALKGSEAVLSAFGPTVLGKTTLRRDFARVLVASMRAAGVKRVQYVSSAFVFSGAGLAVRLMGGTLFRYVRQDEMMRPDLEWTMVRPPRLLDKPATGRIRIEADRLPKGGLVISRGDVARFMLDEAVSRRFARAVVGISD
jgi:putative NADH-flavin reductase